MGLIRNLIRTGAFVATTAAIGGIAGAVAKGNSDEDCDDEVSNNDVAIAEMQAKVDMEKMRTKEDKDLDFVKKISFVEKGSGRKVSIWLFLCVLFGLGIYNLIAIVGYDKHFNFLINIPILLFSVGLCFLISLISVKNTSIKFQEKINELKSSTRIKKANLVQQMDRSVKIAKQMDISQAESLRIANEGALNLKGSGSIYDNYEKSVQQAEKTYENLSLYQLALTQSISNYNKYISTFPTCIYTKMLKLKKEDTIAYESLEKSLEIGQDEFKD